MRCDYSKFWYITCSIYGSDYLSDSLVLQRDPIVSEIWGQEMIQNQPFYSSSEDHNHKLFYFTIYFFIHDRVTLVWKQLHPPLFLHLDTIHLITRKSVGKQQVSLAIPVLRYILNLTTFIIDENFWITTDVQACFCCLLCSCNL